MSRRALALCAILALAPAAAAQVFHVPGDFADPQSAIAGVPAGSTIVVHGGFWLPVTIDKPLTLLGTEEAGSLPLFAPDGPPPVAQSPVTLAGSGSGTVRLGRVWLGGLVDGSIWSACAPSIAGGGFEALHVFDSTVEGAPWEFAYNFTFPGAHAIDVDVPFTWIERCTVRGADAEADDNQPHSELEVVDAGDAIRSTGAVVLLDSTVTGGNGATMEYDSNGAGACPPVCPGGAGGDGVTCAKLVRAGSSIAAGDGSTWYADVAGVPCCTGPSGVALAVGEDVLLADQLEASGPALPGQAWSLSWSVPGSAALLFVGAGVGPAPQLGAPKLHLLPPLFLGVVVTSPGSLAVTVPADAVLTGQEFAIQMYGQQGWSRPLAGLLGP